ncbi:hypothetical protein HCN44_004808 [Aphidius gifuensis]|uniref:G domain-containing protein n=1 Tax=Aphidius gifuensis TaxID=684658 RepID=A0A835CL83_APHGI|nr:hypothetical protein HCN44_004808 [Aphidius gifuensis]
MLEKYYTTKINHSRKTKNCASYPFTTLKPYLRMVFYDDNERIAVADVPGLIEDSHKNRGLGITFFKPAERYAYSLCR